MTQHKGLTWLRFESADLMSSPRKRNLRERVAWWLRRLADRLSGETTWTVFFVTNPPISKSEQDAIIILGMRHAKRVAVETTRANIADRATRAVLPDPTTNGEPK